LYLTRERNGFQALTDGMMALASGDGQTAMVQAVKAEKFLRKPELTNLLSAQAAELTGDSRKAAAVYKKLLSDERTRFVGVRGLLKQKLAEGDRDTALKLAEKAFLMKPSNKDIQDTLFDLQASSGDWAGARKVLGVKLKQGDLPRDVHRRRDAILALQGARAVFDSDLPVEARIADQAATHQVENRGAVLRDGVLGIVDHEALGPEALEGREVLVEKRDPLLLLERPDDGLGI